MTSDFASRGAVDLGLADEVLATGRAAVTLDPVGEILVVRTRRGVFAMRNECPHIGRTLSDATICGTTLRCRGHGRTYRMTTGTARGPYRAATLQLLPAWIEDGHLLVMVTGGFAR